MSTVTVPTRIKLHNILFATNFSSSAQTHLSHAVDLARRYNAALYTVHVLPRMPFVEAAQPDPEQAESLAHRQLPDLINSVSFRDVEHKELIEPGEVAEVLSKLVRKHAIDLIVISTDGREGPGKLLSRLGSRGSLPQCRVPSADDRPARRTPGNDGDLQHILFATDLGPASLHALPHALSWAEENRARLTVLHVSPFPLTLPEFRPENPKDVLARGTNRLRNLIPKGTELWHEPEYVVQFGSPREIAGIILRICRALGRPDRAGSET